jgi:hypothetical protein
MFFLYDRLPCITTLFDQIKNPCAPLGPCQKRDAPKGNSDNTVSQVSDHSRQTRRASTVICVCLKPLPIGGSAFAIFVTRASA